MAPTEATSTKLFVHHSIILNLSQLFIFASRISRNLTHHSIFGRRTYWIRIRSILSIPELVFGARSIHFYPILYDMISIY